MTPTVLALALLAAPPVVYYGPAPDPGPPLSPACAAHCPAGDCCRLGKCRSASGYCAECYDACSRPPVAPAPQAGWYAIAPPGWGAGWYLWGRPDGKGLIVPATSPQQFRWVAPPRPAPAVLQSPSAAPAGVMCIPGVGCYRTR
jgi:hypothetical protein